MIFFITPGEFNFDLCTGLVGQKCLHLFLFIHKSLKGIDSPFHRFSSSDVRSGASNIILGLPKNFCNFSRAVLRATSESWILSQHFITSDAFPLHFDRNLYI